MAENPEIQLINAGSVTGNVYRDLIFLIFTSRLGAKSESII